MIKDVVFNPLSTLDKEPYGAVQVNEPLLLAFGVVRHYDIRQAYIVLNKDDEEEVRYPMSWTALADGYDRFSGEVTIDSTGLYFYCFEVCSPSGIFRIGADNCMYARWRGVHKWAVTAYKREYETPSYLKKGVMYQIFPDRFNIGGKKAKAKDYAVYHENWNDCPEYRPNENGEVMNNDFFGGNLKGITEKLDYIKSFNVAAIYLNPIFEAYSNHKYDTADYFKIDPDFGSEEDFEELIREAKKRGIEIIFDGVFNHTGSDSVYFNKNKRYNSVGAYQSWDSPYHNWFNFIEFPHKYEAWWGISTLPSINEKDPSFNEFINGENGVIDKWMKKGLGGIRLDVVDELPDEFLDKLTARVKSVRKDAIVIGEVWENAATKIAYSKRRRYLQGKQLDSVMNYPFKRGICAFIKSGDAGALEGAVLAIASSYPKDVADSLMNLLGTHDTERILTLLSHSGEQISRQQKAYTCIHPEKMTEAVKRLKLAALLEYTLPGVPCIYYGDEAGVEGYEDPFCRRTFPWGRENKEIMEYYRLLGDMRKYDVFSEGRIDVHYACGNELIFSRYIDDSHAYVVANSGESGIEYDFKGEFQDLLTGERFSGKVTISPMSARILV